LLFVVHTLLCLLFILCSEDGIEVVEQNVVGNFVSSCRPRGAVCCSCVVWWVQSCLLFIHCSLLVVHTLLLQASVALVVAVISQGFVFDWGKPHISGRFCAAVLPSEVPHQRGSMLTIQDLEYVCAA
jgi:hypothetical protein